MGLGLVLLMAYVYVTWQAESKLVAPRVGAETSIASTSEPTRAAPQGTIVENWWHHHYGVFLGALGYLFAVGIAAAALSRRERTHTRALVNLSRRDTLTGLPNRLAINEFIVQELARVRRTPGQASVLYIDIDHFKEANDSLGHIGGDELLVQIANRLRGALRSEDHLARLSGDEFLALIPNIDTEHLHLVAQRIMDDLRTPFEISGTEITVTASIGICMLPDDGEDIDTLLRHADAAIYEAKHKGKNQYALYQPILGQRIRHQLQLRHDLKHALQHQHFLLHYQPLVDMVSGRIVGAEALVRWQDPTHGMRSPADFIPAAEESGLILPLGEWVLRTACQQCKAWEERGYDFYIAVNLSTRQFQDPDLVSKIRNALEETQLAPAKLELEITESAAMLDPEVGIQIMIELKLLGIGLAIDDFGTGYSSLSHLKRIPADLIKIDRSFVNEVHTKQDDFAIVKTILALGESLEKNCLAEGIETPHQYEVLRGLGCRYAQGFWMSRPLTVVAFDALLDQGLPHLGDVFQRAFPFQMADD